MGTTPNYTWPIPDPSDPPNIPQHLGNLAKAQETTVKTIENRVAAAEARNTTQDNNIKGLDERLARAEFVCRGNFKWVNFEPNRIFNSTTMSELLALAQILTIPTTIPAHATHYVIHVMLYVTTVDHGDFRLGAKLNGKELAYFDYRPVGTPFNVSALVYMAYDIELATQTPGDYSLTYWARNGLPGTRTDINTGRAWATFA